MPIAQDIIDRHRAQWLAEGVPEPMGASEEAIVAAEHRLRIRFPEEVREFYRNFGEVHEPKRAGDWDFYLPNGEFLRLYHLDECYPLTDLTEDPGFLANGPTRRLTDRHLYVVFADFMISSYLYAVKCGPVGSEPSTGEVVVDSRHIFPVSSTFEEFLRRCLDDPNSVEYPW